MGAGANKNKQQQKKKEEPKVIEPPVNIEKPPEVQEIVKEPPKEEPALLKYIFPQDNGELQIITISYLISYNSPKLVTINSNAINQINYTLQWKKIQGSYAITIKGPNGLVEFNTSEKIDGNSLQ